MSDPGADAQRPHVSSRRTESEDSTPTAQAQPTGDSELTESPPPDHPLDQQETDDGYRPL